MISNSFLEVKKSSQYNIKKQLYRENPATMAIFNNLFALITQEALRNCEWVYDERVGNSIWC